MMSQALTGSPGGAEYRQSVKLTRCQGPNPWLFTALTQNRNEPAVAPWRSIVVLWGRRRMGKDHQGDGPEAPAPDLPTS